MNKIWFTSDTRFGSAITLELSKRPFDCVKEMDETMINNWNNVVKDNDIVIHLGDFGDYSKIHLLNGKIFLILGNYEIQNGIDVEKAKELGFWDSAYKHEFKYQDEIFILSHKPLDVKNKGFGLFGHIHKLQMVKEYGLNVGVDCHNFTPIDINTVLFYKNAILNYYDDEVFK